MANNFAQTNKEDLYRAIICLIVIIVCALLVNGGKLDISVFVVIITGVTSFYLGKKSEQGSIIK